MQRLLDTVPDEPREATETPPPREPREPKDPKVPKDPKAPAAAEPAAPAEPPIRLRRPKVERPALPIPRAAAPAIPAAPPPAAPDNQWEQKLKANEREMLDDARELEKVMPERYPGFAAKTEKFLRDNAAREATPNFEADSPEHCAWLDANQPKLTTREIREFTERRVAASLEPKLRSEYEAKHQTIQHQLFVRDEEPKIEAVGRQTFNDLVRSCVPEDVLTEIGSVGVAKANERFGLEIETATNVLTAATEDIKEFMRLSRRDPQTRRLLAEEVTDPSNPKFSQHERLRQIVDDVCDAFRKTPEGSAPNAQGKWFVTKKEWMDIPAARRGDFYTFTNQQIIDRAKANLKGVVEAAIGQQRQRLEARGWGRKTSAPPVTVPAVPTPPAAPRGGPIPPAPPTPPNPGAGPQDERAKRIAAAMAKANA